MPPPFSCNLQIGMFHETAERSAHIEVILSDERYRSRSSGLR